MNGRAPHPSMKIAVLADIHANLPALEAVLAHARNGLALLPPDRVRIRAWAEVAAFSS